MDIEHIEINDFQTAGPMKVDNSKVSNFHAAVVMKVDNIEVNNFQAPAHSDKDICQNDIYQLRQGQN